MKKTFLFSILAVLLITGFTLAFHNSPTQAIQNPDTPKPDIQVVYYAEENSTTPDYVPPPDAFLKMHAQTSNFVVNWQSGGECQPWPADAKASFEYAVNIWESLVYSPVTVVVNACWKDLPSGVLGSAGAADYVYNFLNAPRTNTWYPIALANSLAGTDLSPDADINANFNSDFSSWYFGTDNATPSNKWNFATVVLHEICHGLGFIGSFGEYNNGAYWGGGTPYPLIFDRFIENGAGENLIAKYSDAWQYTNAALLSELTSGSLYFDGPNANAAAGGRPRLYAPSSWSGGSSVYHMDEQYNGTANALMTYALTNGETNYDPGPIVKGVYTDMGWKMEEPAPEPTPTPTPVATTVPPSTETILSVTSGTTTTVIFPVGAVAESITATLSLTDTGAVTHTWETIGLAFDLDAVRTSDATPVTTFSTSITITIDYRDQDVAVVHENELGLYYWDNGDWITATKTCSPTSPFVIDTVANRFTTEVCHLTKFALFGKTNRSYLPTTFKDGHP